MGILSRYFCLWTNIDAGLLDGFNVRLFQIWRLFFNVSGNTGMQRSVSGNTAAGLTLSAFSSFSPVGNNFGNGVIFFRAGPKSGQFYYTR